MIGETIYALQQMEKAVDGPALAKMLELPLARAEQETRALLEFDESSA